MIYDSTNPRIMADNIKRLENEIKSGGSILPTVTTSDEGKVLTVNSSGNWDVEDPVTELPSVTTSDEGKVLTVNSSGEWIAEDPVEELPETTSATVGQVLKLDSDKKPEWADESVYTPANYSTSEVDTGVKWVDGKTVYKKTFTEITCPGQNLQVTVNHGLSIDTLVNVEAIAHNATGGVYRILPLISRQSATSQSVLAVDATTIIMNNGSNGDLNSDFIANVTLYYTKNTPVSNTRKKSTK